MPAVTRLGDNSAGHCYSPRPPDTVGQSTVYVNGVLATVIGAHYPAHTCGTSTHDGKASTGSSSVFFEGKAVHRIGDNIDCGDISANGSNDTFCG